MIQKLRMILGWAAVALLVAFIILNTKTVLVNFWYVTRVEAPLAVVVLGSAALGAGAVYMFKAYRSAKTKNK